MKKFCEKHLGILAFIAIVIVCLSFFTYTLSLVSEYSSGVSEQAVERAEFYIKEQSMYVMRQLDDLRADTKNLSKVLSECQNADDLKREIREQLSAEDRDPDLLDILYVRNGQICFWNGDPCSDYSEFNAIVDTSETKLSRVFQYNNRTMAIAVSASVKNDYFDGIVAVFDRYVLSVSDPVYGENNEKAEYVSKAEFTLLCKHDGKIIDRVENSDEFEIGNLSVQDGIIKSLFTDDSDIDAVSKALLGDVIESFSFSVGPDEYILSVSPIESSESGISLVCAYRVSNIYGVGFELMQSITAALLGLAIIMAIFILIIVINRISERRRIYQMEMVDQLLNCPTAKKFSKRSDELLKTHGNSNFAFVSLNINNFGYVTEHFGDNAGKKLLSFASDAIHGMLLIEETYGYAGDGEFLLLLQHRDRRSFSERLNGLYLRLSSFNEFDDGNYKVSVAFAVYEVERDASQAVKAMLDKLKIAKEASTIQSAYFSISFYEDMMHENYIKKAEIEGKMEQALQNSEFHLFYQPKYNLKAKNMDGCEILIRWYDPELESYHTPSEFLPVFEENLFIIKLDHFVFFKACENISKTVESKQICYPVSVNVSRVTAIQSDFIDYYVRIKKKFNIKDNFITLEFTESFAYENYEFLSDTVQKLHENGLLCSIDDFGTGYSSYNILKTIQMDEIKLDKFFLGKGLSTERDQLLLESVIGMVKKLGMKVTQEGVETKEDLYRLEKLGCDVIQGYYFAKPMKYTDYCEFVRKNFT